MKYLGIDFGSKRVGIAISDAEGKLAFPKEVLANSKTLIEDVNKILNQEGINEVVIGESKNFKLEPNQIQYRIERFVEELKSTGVIVHFEPEFLTSLEAERIQGKNDMLDASAAALILKSFLDKKTNKYDGEN